jgi:hypothetical protein
MTTAIITSMDRTTDCQDARQRRIEHVRRCNLLWQEYAAWRAGTDRRGLPVQNLVEHLLHVALERYRQHCPVQEHANMPRCGPVVRTRACLADGKKRHGNVKLL